MAPYQGYKRYSDQTRSLVNVEQDFQDIDKWEAEIKTKAYSLTHEQTPSIKRQKKHTQMSEIEILGAEQEALREIGNKNWIGQLHEFRMSRIKDHERTDPEFKINTDNSSKTPRFSCSVKIPESPLILGDAQDNTTFASKKSAKQYAAKKAIDWLIDNNYMSDEDSAPFPKHVNQSSSSLSTKESFTAQVPTLCRVLGLNCPRYVIEPIVPSSPLYNGYADFGSDPRIKGIIGRVSNIYGKKNAKDEIAKKVVILLTHIKEERSLRIQKSQRVLC